MKITSVQARALLQLIEEMPLGRIIANNALDAVATLHIIAEGTPVSIVSTPNSRIQAIKVIRSILGIGLADAKHYIEDLDPMDSGGTFYITSADQEELQEIKARLEEIGHIECVKVVFG